MKWVIKSDDGRYVSHADTDWGSPWVEFELCDRVEDAIHYGVRFRADEDCREFNVETKKYGKIRRFVVQKYGELAFHVEELPDAQ